MSDRRHIKWLDNELPTLVEKAVLSTQDAERIKQHYGGIEKKNERSPALVVYGVLGSILIGLGIILLFAHNWQSLSHMIRTAIALFLLFSAQVLAGWVIRRRRESVAWCESSAMFLMLMVAAALAIMHQTYHIPTDTRGFALTWMLLSLPLVYLLRATLPAMLYLVGVTIWAYSGLPAQHNALYLWLLTALIIPHFILLARGSPSSHRLTLLAWAVTIWLASYFAPIAVQAAHSSYIWIPAYTGLFAALYLTGGFLGSERIRAWQRPFVIIGAAGLFVVGLILTFANVWHNEYDALLRYSNTLRFYFVDAVSYYLLAVGLPLAAAALLILLFLRRRSFSLRLLPGFAPFLAVLGLLLAPLGEMWPRLIFNLFYLALGLAYTVDSIRQRRLGALNIGLLLISVLIVARFFDSSLGFILRGVAFILVGLGFLIVNLLVVQKRKGVAS